MTMTMTSVYLHNHNSMTVVRYVKFIHSFDYAKKLYRN